jgi:biopolymer transport protein ExbD
MAFDGKDSDDAGLTSINVTPLVDVVLVLLVVLMVAASGAVSEALPLDLPGASSGQNQPTMLRVGVAADGSLSLDGTPTDADTLRQAAREAARSDAQARAAIAADRGARHERVIAVIDLLRTSGVTRLAFLVSPEKS